MVQKKTVSYVIFTVFNYCFIGLFALICLYPLWHVLCASFSSPVEFSKYHGGVLWPIGYSISGYKAILQNPNIWLGYRNTLLYVSLGTLCRMFLTIMGAYVLAQPNFMLRRPVSLLIVFTMYVGGGLIPNYILVNSLKMLNAPFALIIPSAITTWNLIIMKTAFQGVPSSLIESGRLDGASEFRIMLNIVLPVAKATIAVIALYYVVAEWNSWFTAAIYLPANRNAFPLQLVLREILIVDNQLAGTSAAEASGTTSVDDVLLREIMKYAAISVSTMPIIAAYPFVQKYFVKGVMMGSVKG